MSTTFYIVVVNVPAVLYFDAVVMSMITGVRLPEGPEGIFSVMGGFLMFSGLMAGISFLRYWPRSRGGQKRKTNRPSSQHP